MEMRTILVEIQRTFHENMAKLKKPDELNEQICVDLISSNLVLVHNFAQTIDAIEGTEHATQEVTLLIESFDQELEEYLNFMSDIHLRASLKQLQVQLKTVTETLARVRDLDRESNRRLERLLERPAHP